MQTRSSLSGNTESVTYENFINRLDSEAAVTGSHQTFDRAIFADTAQSSEPWRVAETVLKASSANLSRTLVVTQLSQGFNSYDMRLVDVQGAAADSPQFAVEQPAFSEPADPPYRPTI